MSKTNVDEIIEQSRANAAEVALQESQQLHARDQKIYRDLMYKTPVKILRSGLGATLAQVRASKGAAPQLFLKQLSSWTCKRLGTKQESLWDVILQGDALSYRRATEEVIDILWWMKKVHEAAYAEERERLQSLREQEAEKSKESAAGEHQ